MPEGGPAWRWARRRPHGSARPNPRYDGAASEAISLGLCTMLHRGLGNKLPIQNVFSLGSPWTGRLPDRAQPLPTLEAQIRRAGGNIARGFRRGRGAQARLQAQAQRLDLGVDIELNDAVNRIRFEHPDVRAVVIVSARDRVFCSGANIFMLGVSSHAWKVNFCKFTNETRNGLEDSSKHEGLKFLAAVNGSCAGGGYELALACDEIIRIDDRSSAVSLPEVPLLGVLPGTGGLTRLTDKRHVRHDLADVFCTTSEGVRGEKALAWRLVDAIAKPAQFAGQSAGACAGARRKQRPAFLSEGRRAVADRPSDRSRRSHLFARQGDDRSRRARRDFRDQRTQRGFSRRMSARSRRRARTGIRCRSPASSKTQFCRCALASPTSAFG